MDIPFNYDIEGKGLVKVKDKRKKIDLVKNQVTVVEPQVIPTKWLFTMFNKFACIRYSSLIVKYETLDEAFKGIVIMNIFDERFMEDRERLLLHLSFNAGRNQFINVNINKVIGSKEEKEPIRVSFDIKDTNIRDGTQYGKLSILPSWQLSKKTSMGTELKLYSAPAVSAYRGKDMDADAAAKLSRSNATIDDMEHNFNAPALKNHTPKAHKPLNSALYSYFRPQAGKAVARRNNVINVNARGMHRDYKFNTDDNYYEGMSEWDSGRSAASV